MIDLIILTGTRRTKNLPILLESILREFGRTEEERKANGFNIVWLIAYDKYNSSEDISQFYNQLYKLDLKWFGFLVGKPNQKNYGGDLYNDPLKWAHENLCKSGADPYVYILDDDNIIHPRLPRYIKLFSEHPDKDAVVLAYNLSNGTICQQIPSRLFIYDLNNITIANPDPSEIVVKLSVYMNNFPMLGGLEYDFTYIRGVMFKLYEEGKLAFQQELDEHGWGHATTYHNGIGERWEMEEFAKHLDEADFSVSFAWNFGTRRFVIPKEKNKEIMDILLSLDYPVSK